MMQERAVTGCIVSIRAACVPGPQIQEDSRSESDQPGRSSSISLQVLSPSEAVPSAAILPTEVIKKGQQRQGNGQPLKSDEYIRCAVGIMAYNEEANIGRTLRAILEQHLLSVEIEEIIVIASGCTDRTVPIVTDMALHEPRIHLCIQPKREGKASAINLFLKQTISPIVVLLGADIIPETTALESLCAPFKDPKVGMVGGHPIPVNNPATFMGHAVHLVWRLHDRLARVRPKLGEVITFRNVISGIPADSPVDEISIEALISQLGYRLVYQPSCIVYNKGPLTIRDFLKQRRRIYAGHLQVRVQQNYEAATMRAGPILRQLMRSRDFAIRTPKQAIWTLGAVALECIARLQGQYDYRRKRQFYIWQVVSTTKQLEAGAYKVRRLSHAQSVVVFRLILEEDEEDDVNPERKDREITSMARKLLPALRARLRKTDKLSINGPGIMTAVIRADQHGADVVAQRIQEIVQAASARLEIRGHSASIAVASSTLTFPLNGKAADTTITNPSIEERVMAAPAQADLYTHS